jgi:hypothetical protein
MSTHAGLVSIGGYLPDKKITPKLKNGTDGFLGGV